MTTKAAIRVDFLSARLPRVLRRSLPLLVCGLCVVPLALFSLSCSDSGSSASIPAEAYMSRPSGAMAAGDVIRVSYPGAPELNTTQRIQTNGKVSLPMVGDITAAGRTPSGLQGYLAGLYKPHLQDPKTLVTLEASSAAAYVSGEVLKPGEIAIDRPMTVLEVIVKAGGFTKFANRKSVTVYRNQNGQYRRYTLNLGNNPSQPFYVRPSDVIDVKQSNW